MEKLGAEIIDGVAAQGAAAPFKFTAAVICDALTSRGAIFDSGRWTCVPNVSWGWGLDYEADLIAVSKAGWANEVEIKCCKYDLKADHLKAKHRGGPGLYLDERIKRFWYAVPSLLLETALDPAIVDKTFGIIEIESPKNSYDFPRARMERQAVNRGRARLVTAEERVKLMHLGLLRYWELRRKLAKPTAEVPA